MRSDETFALTARHGVCSCAAVITKILVGLDGSPRAPGVFDAAAEIAERFGATLLPLRVIDVPPEFPAAGAGSLRDELPDVLTRVAVAELGRIFQRNPRVVVAKPFVQIGVPSRAIVALADELDVDLIVIGSHGFGALDYLLGTTAASVANHARRNVLVVHDRHRPTATLAR